MEDNKNIDIPPPYVKFEDLTFNTEAQRNACIELYKSIQAFLSNISIDEETISVVIEEHGKNVAMALYGDYMMEKYRILTSLKTTFWYLTAINVDYILINLSEEEEKELYKSYI